MFLLAGTVNKSGIYVYLGNKASRVKGKVEQRKGEK